MINGPRFGHGERAMSVFATDDHPTQGMPAVMSGAKPALRSCTCFFADHDERLTDSGPRRHLLVALDPGAPSDHGGTSSARPRRAKLTAIDAFCPKAQFRAGPEPALSQAGPTSTVS
jgi:hypothetical protein